MPITTRTTKKKEKKRSLFALCVLLKCCSPLHVFPPSVNTSHPSGLTVSPVPEGSRAECSYWVKWRSGGVRGYGVGWAGGGLMNIHWDQWETAGGCDRLRWPQRLIPERARRCNGRSPASSLSPRGERRSPGTLQQRTRWHRSLSLSHPVTEPTQK